MSEALKNIRCPTCGARGAWMELPWGPFCSERCKLVDLGKWLNEEYRVSEPLRPDLFEEFEEFEELDRQLDPDRPDDDS